MDEILFKEHVCSECGRRFSVGSLQFYKYKTNYGSNTEYQCGYTCYDHALLRYDNPDNYYPKEKYKGLVDKCERAMEGQGKTILNPIEFK